MLHLQMHAAAEPVPLDLGPAVAVFQVRNHVLLLFRDVVPTAAEGANLPAAILYILAKNGGPASLFQLCRTPADRLLRLWGCVLAPSPLASH